MWDERYNRKQYLYGTEPNDFLKAHVASIPMGKVLCLAEGEGRNAVFLARQGYQVTAVDSSSVGLQKAQALADQKGVAITLIHSDLKTFEVGSKKWDGIVSIYCHLPPELRKRLHAKVVKGLKSSGTLLLEAYTVAQLRHGTGGPPSAELMMSKEIVEEELAGLHFQHLLELERKIVEGSGHVGLGAVVQAIASAH